MKQALLATFLVLAPIGIAKAESIESFNFTNNGHVVTFSLATTPTAVNEGNDFFVSDLPFTFDGASENASEAAFYDSAVGGGFAFADNQGNILDMLAFTGDQIFTGTTASPTFNAGTFQLSSYFGGAQPFQLQVTDKTGIAVVTPEPSTFLLSASGLLVIVFVASRRWLAREA